MNDFRTELIPPQSASPINLKDKIFTIGSCFADAMGKHLLENKFESNNCFGTVYNPVSIHQLLLFGLEQELPSPASYLENEGIHFNYDFHSSFSSLQKKGLENKIETKIAAANQFLKTANRIIITYGTAFVYKRKDTNAIVANCHKLAASHFIKILLTEYEIVESFQKVYSKLKLSNPNCKIILTASPVRHLKDTLELNAVSKSILRLSCHSIVQQFSDVEYFPAYEILLDDLRDYRFYKTDRLHPTDEAIEYIWKKFTDSYFNEPTKKFINDWKEIKKDLHHKPFQPQSASHQKFLKSTLIKLEKLNSVANMIDEIKNLKSQIVNHKS